jgi:hypothetical protein
MQTNHTYCLALVVCGGDEWHLGHLRIIRLAPHNHLELSANFVVGLVDVSHPNILLQVWTDSSRCHVTDLQIADCGAFNHATHATTTVNQHKEHSISDKQSTSVPSGRVICAPARAGAPTDSTPTRRLVMPEAIWFFTASPPMKSNFSCLRFPIVHFKEASMGVVVSFKSLPTQLVHLDSFQKLPTRAQFGRHSVGYITHVLHYREYQACLPGHPWAAILLHAGFNSERCSLTSL